MAEKTAADNGELGCAQNDRDFNRGSDGSGIWEMPGAYTGPAPNGDDTGHYFVGEGEPWGGVEKIQTRSRDELACPSIATLSHQTTERMGRKTGPMTATPLLAPSESTRLSGERLGRPDSTLSKHRGSYFSQNRLSGRKLHTVSILPKMRFPHFPDPDGRDTKTPSAPGILNSMRVCSAQSCPALGFSS